MSEVETYDADGEDPVKVEPAEIGAHPGLTAEAVGVGGVGVESRVDEIETGTHPSNPAAPVLQRRCVPELVEDTCNKQDPW